MRMPLYLQQTALNIQAHLACVNFKENLSKEILKKFMTSFSG